METNKKLPRNYKTWNEFYNSAKYLFEEGRPYVMMQSEFENFDTLRIEHIEFTEIEILREVQKEVAVNSFPELEMNELYFLKSQFQFLIGQRQFFSNENEVVKKVKKFIDEEINRNHQYIIKR